VTELLDAFPAGHGLSSSLSGARVGLRALTSNRQSSAMADASVALDIAQTSYVLRVLSAQLTFDHVVLFHVRGQIAQLVFAQILGSHALVDADGFEDLGRREPAYPMDVGQCDDDSLVIWNVNTQESRHASSP